MTEVFGVTLLTVIGGMLTAVLTTILGRTRLSRLEAVSRVLKDLPVHDPAYKDLQKVREEDARDLLNARQSPWPILVGFSLASLVLGLLVSEFGAVVRDWSSTVHYVLLVATLLINVFTLALYAVALVAIAIRLSRWTAERYREWRERRQTRSESEAVG